MTRRDEADDEHDHERLLRAAHDHREDVAADLVLAERVLAELTAGTGSASGDAVVDLRQRSGPRCTATSRGSADPDRSTPTEVKARMTMKASTTIATSAPLCRKNRRRTIWPWLRPSISFSSIEFSATRRVRR